ncbi:type VI secretion system protein TssA [Pseudoduganella sp. OTU4001]|uniref:type VI secretion system protein TssA n=1 Tax=Pseudoduganella sp. OTU4001 TaxID=3043854 RepID=UPI00313E7898
MDVLLAETSEAPPCGEDLGEKYDPQFEALERLARGKGEQRIGDQLIPAEGPDWPTVRQQALELMTRSKDLRVALLLTRALVRMEHLPGLRDGLDLIHAMLERYWDLVHPRLEDDDPGMRMNTLAALADRDAMMLDVRDAVLVRAGPLKITVRDLLVAQGRLKPTSGEGEHSQAQINAAIAGAAAQDRSTVEAVQACVARIGAIHALLIDKVGAGLATDLKPMSDMLKYVAQGCQAALGEAGLAPDAGEAATPASEAAATPALPGEIRSRDDAMRLLDTICVFFERTEPGNPAPLLIRRAQRLMNKSFVEIIQDLAPDSLNRIQDIAGIGKS